MSALPAPPLTITEAAFQNSVVSAARYLGWQAMHVRRSKARHDQWATTTSITGWPDLVLFSPRRRLVLAVELKAQKGRLSPEQRQVLADLNASGLPALVWRPSDWDDLIDILAGRKDPTP